MTAKTLKYSHMKLCGNPKPASSSSSSEAPAPRAVEKQPAPAPETTVSFDHYKSSALSHAQALQQHREQRLLVRQARVRHLISQAI
jgi:hypothetical protein